MILQFNLLNYKHKVNKPQKDMQRRQEQTFGQTYQKRTDKSQKSLNLQQLQNLAKNRDWNQFYSKAKNGLPANLFKKVLKMLILAIKIREDQNKQFFDNLTSMNERYGFQKIKFDSKHQLINSQKLKNFLIKIMQKGNQGVSSVVKNINQKQQKVQTKNFQQIPTGVQQNQFQSLKYVDKKVRSLIDQIKKIKTPNLKLKLDNVMMDDFDQKIIDAIKLSENRFTKILEKYRRVSVDLVSDNKQAQKIESCNQITEKIITPTKPINQELKEEKILYFLKNSKLQNQSTNEVINFATNMIATLNQQIRQLKKQNSQLNRQVNILNLQIQRFKQLNQSLGFRQQYEKYKQNFTQSFKVITPDYTIGLKERKYITLLLEKLCNKQVQATHHIYQFKSQFKNNNLKLDNPHIYIDGRKNLLFIFRLSTGRIIGGFIPTPIQKGGYTGQKQEKEAFLFNASNGRKFLLKPQKRQKTYIYQTNFIILGSGDIRVGINQTKIQSFFGNNVSSFQCGELGKQQLITQEELNNPLKQYNTYQIKFRGEQLNNKPNLASFQKEFDSICRSLYFSKEQTKFQKDLGLKQVGTKQLKQIQQERPVNQKIKEYLKKDKSSYQRSQDSKFLEKKNSSTVQGQISKVTIKNPINKFYNLIIIKNLSIQIQPQKDEKASSALCVLGQSASKQLQKKQIQQLPPPTVLKKHESIILDYMQQQNNQNERRRLEQQIQKNKNLNKKFLNLQEKHLNLLRQIQESKKSLKIQQRSYDRYFSSSTLFYNKHQKQKKFIIDILENCYRSTLAYTKLIYRYDLINKVNFHEYIDNVAQLLVIVKTRSGKVIGGYTHQGFRPNEVGYKGFIFSATDEMDFQVNPKSKKLASTYDSYYIIFGNNQLRIKTQDKVVFSNFGIVNNYFLTNGQNVDILIGEGRNVRESQIETFQIYQVIFSQVGT